MLLWGIKYGSKDSVREKVICGKEVLIKYYKNLERGRRDYLCLQDKTKGDF